ncbi:MAG TPA: methyltransferase, partial [Gemmatimonadales bacterium]|nr:methyltransferase [Gemmatimonadales bacterium]
MLALVRATVYATLFISVFLVFIPEQILIATGITRPTEIGALHSVGLVLVVLGGALAIWCILTFALVGKGTPAPFDPPRKLVAAGPYRWVRNPMYIGAATALAGAALFYQSAALVAFAAGFVVAAHMFVVLFEEPTLERNFGAR